MNRPESDLEPAPPGSTATETTSEAVQFRAGPHRLEGELVYPEAGAPNGAVVLAGPHPLLGGDMHNNVVRGLGDGLAAHGLATLRFNYRGVGGSEGPPLDVAANLAEFWATSHVPNELDLHEDVAAAVEFLRATTNETLPLVLVGYSFGCALLPHLAALEGAAALVLIAPTLGIHDYTGYEAATSPLLVIASEDDFAVDADQLRQWFQRLGAPRRLLQGQRDNHFFRGHEPWLVDSVLAFLHRHGRLAS